MSSGKTRGKFVNKAQDWELDDWLDRNNYRETKENRKIICTIIDDAKKDNGLKSQDNLSWEQLDKYFGNKKKSYSLEEKK